MGRTWKRETVDRTHLCLFDILLFINLSQTQFALLMVQSESLLIFKHLLFGFLFPYHIIPHLTHNKSNTKSSASLYSDTMWQKHDVH